MKILKNVYFWKKTSIVSTIICGLLVIFKMYFEKYYKNNNLPFFYIGYVVLFIFLLSELMKFILKRKNNE